MWKDNLREASFRGVPFFYESTGVDGGRRTQTHEFAYRDKPYTEDLGRKAQEIPIEAYVLGDDYMTVRDNLLKACNEEGPGELIHPYYGAIQVNCQVISIRESTSEGRIARISLQFIEAGEKYFPDGTLDRSAAVEPAAEKLDATAADDFAGTFSVEGAPEIVGFSAITEIIKLANMLSQYSIESSLISLLRSPLKFALTIQNIFENLIKNDKNETSNTYNSTTQSRIYVDDNRKSKNTPSKTLLEACSYGNRIPSTSKSITQSQINNNNNAIVDLVRRSAISAASRDAVDTKFDTRNEAELIRNTIADAIDSQAETTSSMPVYLTLTDMRAVLVQAVPQEGLPELVSVIIKRPVSSLVLAYELYEDAKRGDEIVVRNRIRHPGFVGPADIQVISEVAS